MLGLVSLLSCSSQDSGYGNAVGEIAPNIIAERIDGSPFDLSTLRGDYVILDFWGSWCGPCLRELPSVKALSLEIQDQPVTLVSIALEKKSDGRSQKVSAKFGMDWPNQIVQQNAFVRLNAIASDYDVTDIPSVFLISPEGEILVSHGTVKEVRARLEIALKESHK